MSIRFSRPLWALLAASLVSLSLDACSSGGAGAGSNTNWMKPCQGDSECGALKCLCGMCTAPCDAGTCSAASPNARCITLDAASRASCGAGAPSSICGVSCSSTADCAAASTALTCEGNLCLPEGGGGDSGSSGSGGAGGTGGESSTGGASSGGADAGSPEGGSGGSARPEAGAGGGPDAAAGGTAAVDGGGSRGAPDSAIGSGGTSTALDAANPDSSSSPTTTFTCAVLERLAFSQPCGIGLGACTYGTWSCDGLGPADKPVCAGAVAPKAEVCDLAGVDENCDGNVNEGCPCSWSGTTAGPRCGPVSDQTSCQRGFQQCVGGMVGVCLGAINPTPELCDDQEDSDCDYLVDGGDLICTSQVGAPCTLADSHPCGIERGACHIGMQMCVNGAFAACDAQMGATEICVNGIDDDCDGKVDGVPCLQDGVLIDASSAYGQCLATYGPLLGTPCWSQARRWATVGVCAPGVTACLSNGSPCIGFNEGSPVEVCNGLDDDCNGVVDDNAADGPCTCTNGDTVNCGSSTGACHLGTQTCAGGTWGPCIDAVMPADTETCGNGVDDDCDGATDEPGCTG